MASPVTYQFLPWVRSGLTSQFRTIDTLGSGIPGRARLEVGVNVSRRAGAPVAVTRSIEVTGPGEVVGIDRRQIIRTDPKPNATDFEPNFLAIVEFDHPAFTWLFTPAAANAQDRLRPWLVLIVIEDRDGVTLTAREGLPLPVLTIGASARPSRQLPDLAESWAWAHGQVVLTGAETLEDVLREDPRRTASRLICPRRLDPRTNYIACVVPAFESGRLTGLGQPLQAADQASLRPAWVSGSDAAIDLPVYYWWRFSTGVGGDFESLARALRARPIPPEVGRHDMFVGAAGEPLPALAPDAEGAIVALRGALVPPNQPASPWPRATRATVESGLRRVLNLPAQRLGTGGTPAAGPAVAPPLYARWLAAQPIVPSQAAGPLWMRTLNLDPRHRAVAGLATRVVQHEQERLMDQAWAQVGDLERANLELRWAQVAVEVRGSLLRRHVAPLEPGRMLQVTKAAHGRMLVGTTTLAATARASALPEATLAAPFRRAVRPRGPLARRAYGPVDRTVRPFVDRLAAGRLLAAPPDRPPDGLFGFATAVPARPDITETVRQRIVDAATRADRQPPDVVNPAQVRAVRVSDTLARDIVERLLGIAKRMPTEITTGLTPVITRRRSVLLDAELRPRDLLPRETLPVISLPPVLPVVLTDDQINKVRTLATTFRESTVRTIERIDQVAAVPPRPARPSFAVGTLRRRVLTRVDPTRTMLARVTSRIMIPPQFRPIAPRDPLQEVFAGPVFPQPAWELLRDWFPEHLLPGLEHVPANTVSLMQTNPPFVEAFLVGLNHEIGREFLWRELDTDQRCTSFCRFWAPGGRDDIPPINTWNKTAALGSTLVGGFEGQLVLLVRGDLLRRYPSTVIYAAPDSSGRPRLAESAIKLPLFRGRLDPDVTFVGFDLTPEDARDRWWFVFEEQPTEPRFALDQAIGFGPDAPPLNQWNDLTWGHLAESSGVLAEISHIQIAGFTATQPNAPAPRWGASSSAMAAILAQQPVRVSLRGADLLAPP